MYSDKAKVELPADLMSLSDDEFWKELESVNLAASQLSEYTDFN